MSVCPTACLDLWNDRPGLLYPERCSSCGACELLCPTDAITLEAPAPSVSHDKDHGS
ncbi:ATP-binding protein [Kolteria novifilia]|uniref:ATP-binding protein n=1 Tax=Kolteria novifilia TaxID=2527975 RepID=UPI003AF40B12